MGWGSHQPKIPWVYPMPCQVPTEFLYRQIDEAIYDIKPEAAKGYDCFADVIVGLIKRHGLENVIVDFVIALTSGAAFASEEVMKSMIEKLFHRRCDNLTCRKLREYARL